MVAVSFLICSYNYLVNMYNRKTIDKNGKGEIIMLTMPISFEELQELFHTKEACLKFEEMLEQLYGKDILCFYKNGSYPLRDSQSFDSVGNAHDYSVISLTDLFDRPILPVFAGISGS